MPIKTSKESPATDRLFLIRAVVRSTFQLTAIKIIALFKPCYSPSALQTIDVEHIVLFRAAEPPHTMASPIPHPLSALSIEETNQAREVVLALHPNTVLDFRTIYLLEPPKAEVVPFLELEHAGKLTPSTPRPPRLADVRYDVIGGSRMPEYNESVVDLQSLKRVSHQIVGTEYHASLSMYARSRSASRIHLGQWLNTPF